MLIAVGERRLIGCGVAIWVASRDGNMDTSMVRYEASADDEYGFEDGL